MHLHRTCQHLPGTQAEDAAVLNEAAAWLASASGAADHQTAAEDVLLNTPQIVLDALTMQLQ
jgi:hypothetical protein